MRSKYLLLCHFPGHLVPTLVCVGFHLENEHRARTRWSCRYHHRLRVFALMGVILRHSVGKRTEPAALCIFVVNRRAYSWIVVLYFDYQLAYKIPGTLPD